jgi:glycosyltransferase involved in cell wall biosynthesis
LISNTHPHRERMVREYALSHRRHHVVHLALEDNLLAAGASTSYPAADQPFTMTFVGRAERRKGFDALMAALPLVPADPQAIRLHIIGLSQSTFDLEAQRSGLASHIKDCVIVHGRASDATLHACYRDSHAVVAPSRYESYGLVYREAAAFGRPLIACDADPSAVDFIGRTGCGVLATGCEGRALAAAIAAVRDDPSAALAMRRAGLSHARTLHIERLADATLEVYREAVDHVASRRSRQRCRPAIRRELISAHTIQPR